MTSPHIVQVLPSVQVAFVHEWKHSVVVGISVVMVSVVVSPTGDFVPQAAKPNKIARTRMIDRILFITTPYFRSFSSF